MACVVDSKFWKNRRVFLTGHTGFKGSWMSYWLWRMGADVKGYALPPSTEPSLFTALRLSDKVASEFGDVNNLSSLERSLREHQPEVVIHMAAQPLVRKSYTDPVETFQTNIMGTVHLLESCLGLKSLKAVVNVTSDKCYENLEQDKAYQETDPMGGSDPYSSSKGCAELVTNSYRRSFYLERGVGLASARAGNVIGGGDWSVDRLIPDLYRAAVHGAALEIRQPNSVRPWQHVLEPVGGYLMLAQALFERPAAFSQAYNFGPHLRDTQPVSFIVDMARGWWPGIQIRVHESSQNPHEAKILKLSIEKARTELGWEPRWDLGTTVEKTIRWYRAFFEDPSQAEELCREELSCFLSQVRTRCD